MIYLLSLLGFTYTGTTGTATVKDSGMSLNSYLDTTIAIIAPKGTPAQLAYTKDMVIRVSSRVFGPDKETARNFITLLAIESRFDTKAKSSAGAVGLAQVIPKYAKEFGGHCGLVFEPQDMDVPELNLLAGACQFKHLVDSLGSTSLALVAYNAGRYSKSLKSMKSMSGAGNIETANYVAKHTYVKELTLGGGK